MQLFLYGLIGAVLSLAGGVLVLWRAAQVKKIMSSLLAFAAATFLAVAFLDLLPEGVEMVEEPHFVFIAFLAGISIFFILERALMKYSYQYAHTHTENDEHTETLPALIILGDSLHNFLDGIAITIAYVTNPALGLTTALAVAAHELPQEIGDFAILLDRGWSNTKVFLANLFSSFATFVGIGLSYAAIQLFQGWLPYLLAGVAGTFTYIALSDLIPEVHHRAGHKQIYRILIPFIAGLVLMGILIFKTHGN